MAITNTTLGTSASSIYTSSGTSVIVSAFFCNTDSSDRTINVYLVASGDSASNTDNIILKEISIPAGDTYIMNNERVTLGDGDSIQALASTGSVIVSTVSYAGV